ncbi:hypothetical protein [Lactobacillus sp. CBA3605] [Lactiplantibacillus mudanjiangensis]|uniref:hypothetical protein n=1 Tax=Lactiplantibacillus mudanjiangensis TaxID=1296538 RepID=UPI001015C974|nr:hypothetical protein [Lactobacillus sp. CBA3605] [Lactiplantibacillus mudanjiangensis]
MIYETLDEALIDISKLGTWDVDRLIKHYGIECEYTDALPDNVNGYTFPLSKTIFVNTKAQAKRYVKSHEFSHCLLDDTDEPLVETSMVSNSKIETRANLGAFYMMVKHYVSQTGITPNEFNILRFGEAYELAPKYAFMAGNAAELALGIKIPKQQFYG